jgi:hypothetical protein
MITEKDILIAVNQLLIVKYSQTAIYISHCPKDFIRPSFLIEHVSTDCKDINCKTIIQTIIFNVTCFMEVDSHYDVDLERLMERQTEVLNIFQKGYVSVGDRAVKVKACNSGFSEGEAFVELQFECCDDRSEETGDEALISTVNTKVKLKEGKSWDYQM